MTIGADDLLPCGSSQTGNHHSRRSMEGGGRQSRLLGRLLGKLRGDHHKLPNHNNMNNNNNSNNNNSMEKRYSYTSCAMSESTGCGSTFDDDELDVPSVGRVRASPKASPMASTYASPKTSSQIDDHQFAANIDLRYGGQYLTPEQLPEFCDQLHHLVEVIRNIQSYAKVTGEYPREMERRLEQEAREVSALASEARNAREVVARTRAQRRAVRAHKKHLVSHLASLRESEVRELESTVRLSDRKLFKNWEVLKDSTDPAAFESLLDEIKNKQAALECLVRLVDSKRSALARAAPPPTPLPPPMERDRDTNDGSNEGLVWERVPHPFALSRQFLAPSPLSTISWSSTQSSVVLSTESGATGVSSGRKRHDARRSGGKRRRREPRSVPLSGEPSRHAPPPQVTLYIQGTESTSRYRVSSAGAVALTPLDLPSGGSVRDILFFTTN